VSRSSEDRGVGQAVVSRLPRAVLRPLRDGNAFEATVEQLATSVRLGVFASGERLPPERELADTLGVSRTTLREAIAALRAAGMVQTRRGRAGGTVVTHRPPVPGSGDGSAGHDLDRRSGRLNDALDFRRVVEPGAAALAASRDLSADQRAWLVSSRAEVEQAADVSASSLLVVAVTQVQGVLHEMLTAIPALAPNIAHSNRHHHLVVEAILAGDRIAARTAMEEHCDATSALLRGLLG